MKPSTEILFVFELYVYSRVQKMPSGFWNNYDLADIKENVNEQGLYGGFRAIHWKKSQGFQEKNLLNFAADNGWSLINVKTTDTTVINKWVCNGKMIFLLDNDGLHTDSIDSRDFSGFPRWIKSSSHLYKFDSFKP